MGRKRREWPETVPGWDRVGHEAEWIEFERADKKTWALPIKGLAGTSRVEADPASGQETKYFRPLLSEKEYRVHVKVHPDAARWAANAQRVERAMEAAKGGDWGTYRSLMAPSMRKAIVIGDVRNVHQIAAAMAEEPSCL